MTQMNTDKHRWGFCGNPRQWICVHLCSSVSIFIFVLALLFWPAHAAEERRVALIIGNDSYKSLKRLDNGANDARAMERELKAAGFDTTLKVNTGRREMLAAINEFSGRLSAGAVGLFYYAGHGIQARERNYLIPVDAQVESEDDLEADGIEAAKVLRGMEEARNHLNIVILDACRDNPLPKSGRSGARGLAVMPASTGIFIAYATGPGQIAQDGDKGANGVFTGELVKALREPGLKIEDVFKRAATGVRERTGGKQVPWTQASIQGDFYFRPGAVRPDPVAGGADREALFWSSIKDSRKATDFTAYLTQFPQGTFAALARNRIDELGSKAVVAGSPAALARPIPIVDAMDKVLVASRAATIRELPDARSRQSALVPEGDRIHVLGKVKGENWYAVSHGARTGYIVVDALEDANAVVRRKTQDVNTEGNDARVSPSATSVPEIPVPMPEIVSPNAGPQASYDAAYAAAQRGDYVAAAQGFEEFLSKFPSHQLAGNAQYWIGDIHFAKRDYPSALVVFLDAYKKHPRHGKSPDMLYKSAASFGAMGKPIEACKALSLLFREHQDMPERVRRAAASQKQALACD
ncbi:MAG: tol-pal system protein YbgF [Magnetospirillum sp.]|nr:tol-pal system protein YbgF [Magnetospirillum sp.]